MTVLDLSTSGLTSHHLPVPLVAPEIEPAPDLGRTLGLDSRFSEVARIGSGGNAEVFRCIDRKRDHSVALKRLHHEKSNRRSDWEAFMKEPEIMSLVNHSTVPTVYDIYPERMYKPYFTMELIDGIDLCRVLSGLRNQVDSIIRAFPLERLICILAEVCDGLHAAHGQSIIHRDLKPENVMMTASQEVKLIDWGVAKRTNASNCSLKSDASTEGTNRRVSKDEQCIGSPLYMSPEQVQCRADIDHRSDVYALGVVLYDCLTLNTLIRSQTTSGVFEEIVRGDHVAPSNRTLRESVPHRLEAICMKALELDRAARYPTSEQMGNDLREYLVAG